MVKEIILFGNKGIAFVDDEDFEDANRYKWYLVKSQRSGVYTCTFIKNKYKKHRGTSIEMQRFILKPTSCEHIDHVNHNGLDNRRNNLRMCTQTQNNGNRIKRKKNTSSRFKGVSWLNQKNSNKIWRARIGYNKKQYFLGYFETEEAAALAYNEKAMELFGEFACLNQVVL